MVSDKLIRKLARKIYEDSSRPGSPRTYRYAKKCPRLLTEAAIRSSDKEFAKKVHKTLQGAFKGSFSDYAYPYLDNKGLDLLNFSNFYNESPKPERLYLNSECVNDTDTFKKEKYILRNLCRNERLPEDFKGAKYFYDSKKGFGVTCNNGLTFTLKNPELLEDKLEVLNKYNKLSKKIDVLRTRINNERKKVKRQGILQNKYPGFPSTREIENLRMSRKEIERDERFNEDYVLEYALENGVYPD